MIVLGDHRCRGAPGTPEESPESDVDKMMRIARRLLTSVSSIRVSLRGREEPLRIKMGIARGQAYSALVGVKMTYFTFFGQ
eukprot:8479-Rhodomonas_salina.1